MVMKNKALFDCAFDSYDLISSFCFRYFLSDFVYDFTGSTGFDSGTINYEDNSEITLKKVINRYNL